MNEKRNLEAKYLIIKNLEKKAQAFVEAYDELLKGVGLYWDNVSKSISDDSKWMLCGSIMQDLTIANKFSTNALVKIEKLTEE